MHVLNFFLIELTPFQENLIFSKHFIKDKVLLLILTACSNHSCTDIRATEKRSNKYYFTYKCLGPDGCRCHGDLNKV